MSVPSSEPIRVHVWISGRVQGVGYRYFTTQQAKRLQIKGWVKNLPDGRVEAVFEGRPEAVEAIVQWCHRGAPKAIVQTVMVESEVAEGLQDFTVR